MEEYESIFLSLDEENIGQIDIEKLKKSVEEAKVPSINDVTRKGQGGGNKNGDFRYSSSSQGHFSERFFPTMVLLRLSGYIWHPYSTIILHTDGMALVSTSATLLN